MRLSKYLRGENARKVKLFSVIRGYETCNAFSTSASILPNPNLFSKQTLISRAERMETLNLVLRSDNVVIPNKESGTLRVLYLAPCGARTTTTPRHPRLRSATASHKKQNLPFPFSKKIGGAKKG